MLLTFTINRQLIKRTDCEIPVAKSENYLYAQFSFTDDWEGTKTAIFGDYSIQLGEDNKCLVPWEAIKEPGFSVSVFCGQRVTANVAYVDVLPSGYKEGQTPQPPSPTVYDQILDELEKRLSAEDVLAGTNVTVTKNADGTITISAQGGGSGDIQIDASLKKVNDVYGIDFTSYDPTDEEAPFDKPNNAMSATTFVAVLTKMLSDLTSDILAALAQKQNILIAGTGISIVNDVISATLGWSVEVLQSLPASGQSQTFYFVEKQDSEQGDVYDEYIWVNNAFELIGSTQVDLTNYVTLTDLATELLKYYTKTQIDSLLSGKANAFTVGENLSLSNGVLSADDKSFKIVDTLPQSDIEDIYYLTKKTRPTYNYGDYCTNKVPYPTATLPAIPSWIGNYAGGQVIFYNSYDEYFYLIALYNLAQYGYEATGFSINNGVLKAGKTNGFWVGYKCKSGDASWTEYIPPGTSDNSLTVCTVSSVDKFKFVYVNYPLVNYVDGQDTYTLGTGGDINVQYFNPSTGQYLGDLDNVDESQIFTYNINVHRNNAWSVVGEVDLQKMADYFISQLSGKQNTLVSGTSIKTINSTSLLGSGDISVQPVTATATITDNSTTALADNTEYTGSNLTTVTFTYPSGDFECYLSLSFASSGTITVTFPTSSYIGSAPTFANGETWEISIKRTGNGNAVIVAGKVVSNA